MCLKVTLEVSIVLILFNQIMAEPSCSKYDYEEKLLSKVIRMEIKMEELDEKSRDRDVEVTHKLDSYAGLAEETKSAMLQDLAEYKANISGMIQKELDILRLDIQGAAAVIKTIEAFKKNISETMDAVTMDIIDKSSIPVVNFQVHNPSKLTPVSGEPFVFTTIDVNNGEGYNAATGMFTAPVAGLYAFSLQVCANDKHMLPVFIKENAVLLPTVFYGIKISCTSSSVYTQLSVGDRVWIRCSLCGSGYQMWQHSVQGWNTFSGALVHT